MELHELESEALKLAPDTRAKLAEKLLHSLEELSEEEIDRLWVEEALRRYKELENGTARARSAADVFKDARSRLE